jgi:hypothetical protein
VSTPRPTGWEVTREFWADPVPGDPGELHAVAGRYRDIAGHISAAAKGLQDLGDLDMRSKAVEKFRERAAEVAAEIAKAEPLYSGAAEAVDSYATGLDEAQDRADLALTAVMDTAGQLESARIAESDAAHAASTHSLRELAGLDPLPGAPTDPAAHLAAARGAVDQLQAEFDAAVQRIRDAVSDRDAAATAAITAIGELSDTNALKDGFWDKVGDFLGDVVDFLDKALKVISDILDKFEILLLVASIVLLFVPGGGLLVMALRVLSALAKIQKVIKIARTTVDVIQVVRGKKSAIEFVTGLAKGQVEKLAGKGVEKLAGNVLGRVLSRTGEGTLFAASNLVPLRAEIDAVPGTFASGNGNYVRMSMLNDSFRGAYSNSELAGLATRATLIEGGAHAAKELAVKPAFDAGNDWVNNQLTDYSVSNGGNPYLFDWNDPLGEPQPFSDYREQMDAALVGGVR